MSSLHFVTISLLELQIFWLHANPKDNFGDSSLTRSFTILIASLHANKRTPLSITNHAHD